MIVDIEKDSGFCFGVVNAIKLAEDTLKQNDSLYCLGDIVHNEAEVNRLKKIGIQFVEQKEIEKLEGKSLLFRAHGEHPDTYKKIENAKVKLIDATCPIVLKLQQNIKQQYLKAKKENGQIVVFGNHNHPEAIGLRGQTEDTAIIIESKNELDVIDFSRPIYLFSQTTKSGEHYDEIVDIIKQRIGDSTKFFYKKSVCGQVANRAPKLRKFIQNYDLIIFVSGKKSSNGKFLYGEIKKNHPNSYLISGPSELNKAWFSKEQSIGISGATSTPLWLMEEVRDKVLTFL